MSVVGTTPLVIPDVLRRRVEQTPQGVAAHVRMPDGRWETLSWIAFQQHVLAAAAHMRRLGLCNGVKLVICLPSSLEWEIVRQAAMLSRAVIVGVDAQVSPEELEWVIGHCGASWLLAPGAVLRRLPAAHGGALQCVQLEREPQRANRDWRCWPDFLQDTPPTLRTEPEPRPEDLASIVYTSGTTGKPKGIAVTHGQVVLACRAILEAFPELCETDTMICWLPMSALFQRIVNLVAIGCGMSTAFLPDPRQITAALAEVQPTFLIGVPRFFEKLRDHVVQNPSQTRVWRERLRFAVSGSAPLARSVLEDLLAADIPVLEAYGLSENAVPLAANRVARHRLGSVGIPLSFNSLRFAEDHEILVQGPAVFSNYYGEPRDARMFTPDGFYHTGDIGELDADGFLYLRGRKAEFIKLSTGRKISPLAIENAYARCRFIDQVIVLGEGQKYLVALLTVHRSLLEQAVNTDSKADPFIQEATALLEQEFAEIDSTLTPYERPQAFGIVAEPWSVATGEVTSSGKLRRRTVSQHREAFIKSLFSAPAPRFQWEKMLSPAR